MAKDTLSRQSSVSEDSETSLTEESGAKLQRSVSSPAVATTVEAKEGLVTSLKSLVSESGPIKDIVGTFTTLTFDSSASTANSSKRALASADNSPKSSQASAIKQNDLTGRSRFTITRIFESIGNVSADVANRIGLDTVALSKAKKVGRSGSTDQDLKSIYSKSHKIENNPNEDDFDNLPESYVKNGDDIEHDEGESLSSSPQESSHQDVNDTTSNNADEHLGSSSQKGTENSHKKEREDSSAGANAANGKMPFNIFVSSSSLTLKLQKLKGRRKRGNIVAEAKMRPGRKKCFWKISKAFFASKTQILCLQHMLHRGANEDHLGNTEETLTSNVSSFAYPSNMS